MRKIYKIIGGMLAAGVLIAGIGSGIAFAEYSSFEYGGEVTLEGSKNFTKTVEYKVTLDEDAVKAEDSEEDEVAEAATEKIVAEENTLSEAEMTETDALSAQEQPDDLLKEVKDASLETGKNQLNIYIGGRYTIVEDEAVPKDVIRFTLTYLSDNENIIPTVDGEIVKNEGKTYNNLYMDTDFYHNDFRNMIRAKDLILSDLKNHKISDYRLDGVEKIQIYINPEADFDINVLW